MDKIECFLSYLTADKGYSGETITVYRAALVSFHRFYSAIDNELDWQNIHPDIIRRWMADDMQRGVKARTVAKQLSALRTFYKYLLRMGAVDKDPVRLIKNPKIQKPLPSFLKTAEVNRLFDDIEFPQSYEGRRDRTILLTFYHTGVRMSELIGLNVHDIDMASAEIKVTGKRNKQRIIPFGQELVGALQEYMVYRADFLHGEPQTTLFLSRKKQALTKAQVGKIVRDKLSLVTHMKKRSPHVLRHTFATEMLNHGADLEAIKELLGHDSVTTTEVYTHTTFADLKKEYQQAHPRA